MDSNFSETKAPQRSSSGLVFLRAFFFSCFFCRDTFFRSLSACRVFSYQKLNHVVSAAFHQQYRDTERNRETEKEKKRGASEWGEERRPGTDSNCLCLLVRRGLNQSLRSCALETRPNDMSSQERREEKGCFFKKKKEKGSKGERPLWRRVKEPLIKKKHILFIFFMSPCKRDGG